LCVGPIVALAARRPRQQTPELGVRAVLPLCRSIEPFGVNGHLLPLTEKAMMNTDQFQTLLAEFAHIAQLADPSDLLKHHRLQLGGVETALEHQPAFDPDLLQLRVQLGTFDESQRDEVLTALLESNYLIGYGGQCVYSLLPTTNDVVLTMRLQLDESISAQELWQQMSDLVRHSSELWQQVMSHDARVRSYVG